jgi:hypothetical protein
VLVSEVALVKLELAFVAVVVVAVAYSSCCIDLS